MVYGIQMSKQHQDDSFSAEETERRFQAALKAGLVTPPKPLKDKPKIRPTRKPDRPSKSDA
jgi:hypothetical protein